MTNLQDVVPSNLLNRYSFVLNNQSKYKEGNLIKNVIFECNAYSKKEACEFFFAKFGHIPHTEYDKGEDYVVIEERKINSVREKVFTILSCLNTVIIESSYMHKWVEYLLDPNMSDIIKEFKQQQLFESPIGIFLFLYHHRNKSVDWTPPEKLDNHSLLYQMLYPENEVFKYQVPCACYFYCKYIINKRWKEAEDKIEKSSYWMSLYAVDLVSKEHVFFHYYLQSFQFLFIFGFILDIRYFT